MVTNKERQGILLPPRLVSRHQHHQRSTITRKEWQGIPIPSSIIHCLLDYIYILSKHHMFSLASTLSKHHIPLFQTAFRQHHMSVLSKTSSSVSPSAKTVSHKTVPRRNKNHMILSLDPEKTFE